MRKANKDKKRKLCKHSFTQTLPKDKEQRQDMVFLLLHIKIWKQSPCQNTVGPNLFCVNLILSVYRVTIQLVQNLPFTSIQKFRFGLA